MESHEAIRQWVRLLTPICDRFDVDRALVRVIFVDETMIRIRGRQAWVWVAFELGVRVFLAFHVSYNRSVLDAHAFLKRLRHTYGRKLIWTDEGRFYPEACGWLRLEHRVYPTEWKNLIERMNQSLKDRLECIDDMFPCLKEGCDRGACPQLDTGLQVLPQPREDQRRDGKTSDGVRREAGIPEVHQHY